MEVLGTPIDIHVLGHVTAGNDGVGHGAHELTNLDGIFDIVQAMRKSDSQAAHPHSGLVFADGCGLVWSHCSLCSGLQIICQRKTTGRQSPQLVGLINTSISLFLAGFV